MGVRIYSLAKELNVDSKELVDICTRAGITGKGSALASLTDDEVAKIKAFISAGTRPSAAATPAPAPSPSPAPPSAPPPMTRPTGPLSRPQSVSAPPPMVRPGAPGSIPQAGGRVPSRPAPLPVRPAAAPLASSAPTAAPVNPAVEEAAESVEAATSQPTPVEPTAAPAPAVAETPSSAPAAPERPAPSPTGSFGPLSSRGGGSFGQPASGRVPVRRAPTSAAPAASAPPLVAPAAVAPEAPVAPVAPAEPVAEAPPTAPAAPAASTTISADETASSAGNAPVRPGAAPSARPFTSPLGGRQTGGIRALPSGNARPAGDSGGERKPRSPDAPKTNIRMPGVRLAPLPANKPAAPVKSNDPPAQQPIIRLPAHVLGGAKSGTKAGANPLNQFVQEVEAKRAAAGADRKPGGPPGTAGRPRPGTPAPAATPATGVGALARKKGKGRPGEEDEEAAEAARRKAKPSRHRKSRRDEEGGGGSSGRRLIRQRGRTISTAAPRKSGVVIPLPTTVRAFCEAAGIPAAKLLKKLMDLKVTANINAWLDDESAMFLAAEFGVEAEFKREVDLEEELIGEIEGEVDAAEDLLPRAPIITFLGHVDHGKTSLLDKIIGIDVASRESGGITQHIRAYRIENNGHPIAFVDTPGHEAFTEMRARGANVTDIAVLVVAAGDGVMPQTEEALNHARAAEVPIIVALNKTDLPYNKDKVYQQLAAVNLLPAEWGGEVEVIPTSALTGAGIPELLDTILTLTDLYELRANPNRAATGTCLESRQDGDRGVAAKIIVQNGTLRTGDVIVCGSSYGRVKAMYNPLNPREQYEEAGPSTPVDLIGFDQAPLGGDPFYVLDDITEAREIAEKRDEARRQAELAPARGGLTLEGFQQQLGERKKSNLNLIIRADTRGSIEAIRKELSKLDDIPQDEVQVRILQALVGQVTEGDVHLADASDGIIIAFNVVPDEKAASLAKSKDIEIRRYSVIYEISDQVLKAIEGKLAPEERTVELGVALVLRTFSISRLGMIAGCRVHRGTFERNSRVRIIRDGRIIGEYGIESLRREKDDAKEVREGYECGIRLTGFNDLKEGDVFECYRTEKVARKLD